MVKSWKVILATLVIYVAGIVSGGLVANQQYQERLRRVAKGPNSTIGPWALRRMDFLQRISHEIDLDARQRDRIGEILRQSRDRTRPLREKFESGMREEMREVREKIRAELNPEQLKRFDELMKPRGPGDKRRDRPLSRNPRDAPRFQRPFEPGQTN